MEESPREENLFLSEASPDKVESGGASGHIPHRLSMEPCENATLQTNDSDGPSSSGQRVAVREGTKFPLVPTLWKDPLDCLGEVLSVISAFLLLGVKLVMLDRAQDSNQARQIIYISRLVSSFWPLLFSAALGSTLRSLARWKSQKGTTVSCLEFLMLSQSVFGTVRAVFLLRVLSPCAVMLLVLWSISPLGSQASFRGVYLRENLSNGILDIPMSYAPTDYFRESSVLQFQTVNFTHFDEMYIIGIARFQNAVYLPEACTQYSNGTGAQFNAKSSFLQDQYGSLGEDVWGNIRIPHIFSLPGYDDSRMDEWLAVPDDQIINYTSLIGIPFGPRPSNFIGNTSFVMNSSHHEFECDPFYDSSNQTWLIENYANMTYHHFSNLGTNWTAVQGNLSASGIFMDTTKRNVNIIEDLPPKDIYFGYTQEGQRALVTKCKATVYYVESNVTCQQLQPASLPCRVSHIRQINPAQQLSPPTLTFFDLIGESLLRSNWTFNGTTYHMPVGILPNESFQGYDPTQYVIANFPYALPHLPNTQIQGLTAHGQMALYLDDPTMFSNMTVLNNSPDNSELPDLRSVDSTLISQRLTLLLNTFFRAMLNTLVENNSDGSPLNNYMNASTNFLSPAPSTYALDKLWISIYLASSVILLVISFVALGLRFACRAPEVFGYVSLGLRYSSFLDDPRINTTMDGSEVSRKLAEEKVMVGNVNAKGEPGRITFGKQGLVRQPSGIEKDRAYLYV